MEDSVKAEEIIKQIIRDSEKNDASIDFLIEKSTELRKNDVVVNLLAEEKIKDSRQNRGLKGKLAYYFMGILALQLLIMNIVFICTGMGQLFYNQWTLDLYMTGTLAQVFGVVLVITKNLFPLHPSSH